MDDDSPPEATSLLGVLPVRVGTTPTGKSWPAQEFEFLRRAMLALVGMAGSHLAGLSRLFNAAPPLYLFPATTMVRSVAEACGRIWWLMEPWLDDTGRGRPPSEAECRQASMQVLSRAQMMQLATLADRRRRVEATNGDQSAEYREAQLLVSAYKSELTGLHGSDPGLVLTGGRKCWRVGGEGMPDATNEVIAVTEYAYGQQFRGTGINPYPLYCGFAHGSVELAFAHLNGASGAPWSALIRADPEEARTLVTVACRMLAAGFELACLPLGRSLESLNAWEDEVNQFVSGN